MIAALRASRAVHVPTNAWTTAEMLGVGMCADTTNKCEAGDYDASGTSRPRGQARALCIGVTL